MKHAFSLIELSIVLVILGLLAGGILSGQSLINAAELRATSSQIGQYQTAVYSFRDRYFSMPGDMTNATQFWGSAGGDTTNSACFSAQSTASRATCNGNGDGKILTSNGVALSERISGWKHLANAGLIEGSYSGVPVTASILEAIPGEQVPKSKIASAYFDLVYEAPSTALYGPLQTDYNVVGLYSKSNPTGGVLKTQDAWNMDTKLDDGKPLSGAVFANKQSSLVGTNCASSDLSTATYDFAQTGQNCVLKIVVR